MEAHTMTTQATHTPGPWAANDDGLVLGNLDNYEGEAPLVCTCGSADDFNMEPALHLANARLIAAAPDLLAALRAIAGMKCDGDLWHGNEDGENVTNDETHDALVDALCIAREAIAQMEGAQ
jgi:hypothetical protein